MAAQPATQFPAKMRQVQDGFRRPPLDFRPLAFWFWNADPMDRTVIAKQLREMKRQGMGGIVPFPLHGCATPYAEEEWYDLWEFVAYECKKLGLLGWLYDEHHCPSGTCAGKVVRDFPEYRRVGMIAKQFTVKRGREFTINLHRDLSLKALLKVYTQSDGKVKEIEDYALTHERGTLEFTWKNRWNRDVCLWILGLKAGDATTASGFGTKWAIQQPGHLDMLNPDATRAFLRYTFDGYDKRISELYGNVIPGAYTDEPGIEYGIRSRDVFVLPYTESLFGLFAERFKYRIEDHLAALVAETEDSAGVRSDFWWLVSDLFARNFMGVYADWCRQRNLEFTGHFFGEERLHGNIRYNGDIYSAARHMSIPGIDMLQTHTPYDDEPPEGTHFHGDVHRGRRVPARLLTSVAHATGARRVSAESAGVCYWGVTLQQIRRMTDFLCAQGVNLLVDNGWPVSCVNVRRIAGRSMHEPWWPYYRKLADYSSRLSYVQSLGRSGAEIGVLYPSTAAFGHIGWSSSQTRKDLAALRKADRAAFETHSALLDVTELLDLNYREFDYLFEAALEECEIEKGCIRQKGYAYRCLIMPSAESITLAAWRQINAFLRSGGFVVVVGAPPRHTVNRHGGRKSIPSSAWSRSSVLHLPDLASKTKQRAVAKWLKENVPSSTAVKATIPEKLQIARRILDDGEFVFLMNYADRENDVRIVSSVEGARELWSLDTGRRETTPVAEEEEGRIWSHVFQPHESVLLAVRQDGKRQAKPRRRETEPVTEIKLDGPWEFRLSSENLLLLDTRIAPDHQGSGIEKRRQSPRANALWQPMEKGKGSFVLDPSFLKAFWLKAVVNCREHIGDLSVILEGETATRVFVNGREARQSVRRTLWDTENVAFDIGKLTKRGRNVITIYKECNDYGRIEYMRGWHGCEPTPVVLGGSFKVDSRGRLEKLPDPDRIETGSWHTQGYPSYAGEATLAQEIQLDEPARRATLRIRGARDVIAARVNGRKAGTRAWSPYEFEIGNLLKKGRNRVELVVSNTLGNILKNTYFGWDDNVYPSGITGAVIEIRK